MMKYKWAEAYMKCAETFGNLSHANRAKVGCVIVKDNAIISVGYNGMPAGWENECENEAAHTKPEVLHAETNAIAKVAKSTQSCGGAELFCTMAPCIDCAKLIHQSGITAVYYANDHLRSNDGIEFLRKCNIEVNNVAL